MSNLGAITILREFDYGLECLRKPTRACAGPCSLSVHRAHSLTVPEPHAVFVYGPLGFVIASFLASGALSHFAMRRLERRRGPLRRPHRMRALTLLGSIASVWIAGTLVGLALLSITPNEVQGRLPADHVDATVLAHIIPTTAPAATRRLVQRLAEPVDRWDPPGASEARLVLAARIDLDHDAAVTRLADARFRTHAGRFASVFPTPNNCARGLDALAEAMQGGALKELMGICQSTPGDPIGYAAFKVGDFMIAAGSERESIISRQPLTPRGEPSCYAEGPDMPASSLPLCRLLHAELFRKQRIESLRDVESRAELQTPYARRWVAAIRAELDAPLAESSLFTIDPVELVERPFRAVVDEPVAVYEDIREFARGALTPGQSAWVRLAIAAERSAMGRHEDAWRLVLEAKGELNLGAGASADERAQAHRVIAAIALRSLEPKRIDAAFEVLDPGDALHPVHRAMKGEILGRPAWASLLPSASGRALAHALDHDPSAADRSLLLLALTPIGERDSLREWLKEAYPACESCGFFKQLDHLTRRLDAGFALGDEKFVAALSLVVARFEAVFLERTLALSLRNADPEPF